MIGFPVALIFANGVEWYAHKYILHGTPRPGKPRYSPVPKSMKSHWQHHKIVRTTDYRDEGYEEGLSNWRTRNEVASLLALTAVTSLALPVAPFFTLGTYYAAGRYFYVHRRSHLEPEWGKKAIPWHYDHHMNTNQDANWCVTRPWFDYIMGTRIKANPELAESNPLGINLPSIIENPMNRFLNKCFPQLRMNQQG
ncbi:fatty acid hydroxylase family protein [Marinobacter nauticus]|uniref:Fatty acid hydroxylase family protein n=1 Tax=Marinobacter nauticus TaxID=2743 RepID=A0A368XS22_MARNT|nr:MULTISPECIES: sterol desaturase family protein [Marinobacter]RCW70850.1 fatty acid hydroxylase family protein [Marinobacter nauticus]